MYQGLELISQFLHTKRVHLIYLSTICSSIEKFVSVSRLKEVGLRVLGYKIGIWMQVEVLIQMLKSIFLSWQFPLIEIQIGTNAASSFFIFANIFNGTVNIYTEWL